MTTIITRTCSGAAACCGSATGWPGAGWRGPQATERRCVPHLPDRGLPVHDHPEPGRVVEAGETVRSDTLLHRVARPGAARRHRAGMNALSGGRRA
ncbi:hypothetical protein [Yersinia enterocolitica]|uniref:hypothetical protein n=1 Tax=Yersinia enterocolitica TaxID=630 RepID=UPI0028B2FEFE|nr:hypothetical protein [Yersinia enterocolitica]